MKVLRTATFRAVLGLSPRGNPGVILLMFQELFVGAWSEHEGGKESPELGWFSLPLPSGPLISVKGS